MAITPTYSWPLPDNDDLVKDGAEAIRDLGNAIDTTVGGLPGAGLVHIETQTFSAVSGVNFSNDVFTSTYQDYFFKLAITANSTPAIPYLRFRAGGSDSSANNYRYITERLGAGGSDSRANGNPDTEIQLSSGSVQGTFFYSGVIFAPKASLITGGYFSGILNTTTLNSMTCGFHFELTTSFDSLSILVPSGSITGNMSIYGVKQ